MRKFLVLCVLVLLVLCSCRTTHPYDGSEYYQGLGLDGEFVITVNAGLLDVKDLVATEDTGVQYITDRMTRLSLALSTSGAGGTGDFLSEGFSDYDFHGALEGDFPKGLVNTALGISGMFTKNKDKDSGLKFYVSQDGSLETAVPANGIILFSSSDVVSAYEDTYRNWEKRISDEDAMRLSGSQVGIYVSRPSVLPDLGFAIPQTALENIRSILLVMDDNCVTAEFTLMSEDLASSFSVIVRGGYVTKLKQEGKAVDIPALKKMFTLELDKVKVNNLELDEQQLEAIRLVIDSLLDLIG